MHNSLQSHKLTHRFFFSDEKIERFVLSARTCFLHCSSAWVSVSALFTAISFDLIDSLHLFSMFWFLWEICLAAGSCTLKWVNLIGLHQHRGVIYIMGNDVSLANSNLIQQWFFISNVSSGARVVSIGAYPCKHIYCFCCCSRRTPIIGSTGAHK